MALEVQVGGQHLDPAQHTIHKSASTQREGVRILRCGDSINCQNLDSNKNYIKNIIFPSSKGDLNVCILFLNLMIMCLELPVSTT